MKIFSETHHLIPAAEGQLELMVGEATDSLGIAIVCHPNPQFGGHMGNKIVTTITRACQALSFHTIRFNFRGVGESTGVFDEGVGEQTDLATVLDWAQKNLLVSKMSAASNAPTMLLAGFSFGAFVALHFCQSYQPDFLLLVAPPSQYQGFHALHLPQATRSFLIVADQDDIVSTPDIVQWAAGQPFQEITVVSDTGHFFHGKLLILRDIIMNFLRES